MTLDLRLQQKLVQQLVMTPQLQQAIKLLQLSHLEMADVIREELEANPILEDRAEQSDDSSEDYSSDTNRETDSPFDAATDRDAPSKADTSEIARVDVSEQTEFASDMSHVLAEAPNDQTPEPTTAQVDREMDWESYLESYSYSLPATAAIGTSDESQPIESTLSKPPSLKDHLRWQVQMGDFTPEQKHIAHLLIEEINEDGYLLPGAIGLVSESLSVSLDSIETVVMKMQSFDPVGVAARSLRESLLLQAKQLSFENPLVNTIIDKYLNFVEHRNLPGIARELKVSQTLVHDAVRIITQLEPRPGRAFSDKQPQYITPDIYVYKVANEYTIVLNEDGLPKLRVSNYYRNTLKKAGGATKSYIQEKLRNAMWLIRSIHMRQRTIYRVMESILKFQRSFFEKGVSNLKPLVLRDVAEDLEMHESTISRVTTNKYVHTPQGIFELKFFFNSSINKLDGEGIASESVRDRLKAIIAEENPSSPYSDKQLVDLLKKSNIDIARRTIAKYREMLKIPSSSKRKQLF